MLKHRFRHLFFAPPSKKKGSGARYESESEPWADTGYRRRPSTEYPAVSGMPSDAHDGAVSEDGANGAHGANSADGADSAGCTDGTDGADGAGRNRRRRRRCQRRRR